MTGGDTAVGGPAERRLEAALADARLFERGPDGDDAHVGRRGVETPEGVHADAGDDDGGGRAHGAAAGAKA